jgi:hypothetical protein
MQLITSKTLPPIPLSVARRLAKSHGRTVDTEVKLELGLRYCPSMDLVATYPMLAKREDEKESDDKEDQGDTGNENYDQAMTVDVWRLNGQKVFEVSLEDDDESTASIVDIDWRDDGK